MARKNLALAREPTKGHGNGRTAAASHLEEPPRPAPEAGRARASPTPASPRSTFAVGYLRRSTDRQEQSIPDQLTRRVAELVHERRGKPDNAVAIGQQAIDERAYAPKLRRVPPDQRGVTK